MWIQYVSTLFHFSLSVGMGCVLAATAWLYADAYKVSRSPKELLRVIGLLLLGLAFFLSGMEPQGVGWTSGVAFAPYVPLVVTTLKMVSYGLIIASLILEPLQDLPYAAAVVAADGFTKQAGFLLPLLAAAVGLLYWRRVTIGLEAHVRRPALAFWGLAVYEIFQVVPHWYATTTVSLWNLIAPFGWVWWSGRLVLAVSLLLLGSWVFGYLLKQFTTQLFLIFGSAFLTIFLMVTAGYTGMLLAKIRSEAINEIKTSLNVLTYALGEQQARLLSEAKVAATNPGLIEGVTQNDPPHIAAAMDALLQGKRVSLAVVVDKTGQVVWRNDHPDSAGQVWPDTLTVNRLIKGEDTKTVVGNAAGGMAEISLMAATPIHSGDSMVGGVLMGLTVDSLLLSGIKSATGLEAAVFHKQTLVAASMADSIVGIEEKRSVIVDPVLKQGKMFEGGTEFLSIPYLAVYKPLQDSDQGTIGMLFSGRPESDIMATAAYSLEVTFYITAILMAGSLIPAWIIAKSIAKQVG